MNKLHNVAIDICFKNSYVYNFTVEDTNIDRKNLKISHKDRIFTICGAGDHIFQYLLDNPEIIVTCDINQNQLYLMELKIASIKVLTRDEFMDIYGGNNYKLFLEKYEEISNLLSTNAKYFWNKNKHLMKNFVYSGSTGKITKLIKQIACFNKGKIYELIMLMENNSNKKDIIDFIKKNKNNIENEVYKLIQYFVNFLLMSTGVPSNQKNKICQKEIIKIITDCINKLLSDEDKFINTAWLFCIYTV